MNKNIIGSSDMCANCGTNLYWWKYLKNGKKGKVYIDDASDLYCSKQCFKEYQHTTLKEITEIK